jgi:hypothetical protein
LEFRSKPHENSDAAIMILNGRIDADAAAQAAALGEAAAVSAAAGGQ